MKSGFAISKLNAWTRLVKLPSLSCQAGLDTQPQSRGRIVRTDSCELTQAPLIPTARIESSSWMGRHDDIATQGNLD